MEQSLKKICILGFAFKANTNDTRESAAINICNDLIEEGAVLFIHDPKVDPKQIENDLNRKENNQLKEYKDVNFYQFEGNWCSVNDLISASEGSDAIVVLTEWKEYSSLDWVKISKKMRKTAWLFDFRSIIPREKVTNLNLNFCK